MKSVYSKYIFLGSLLLCSLFGLVKESGAALNDGLLEPSGNSYPNIKGSIQYEGQALIGLPEDNIQTASGTEAEEVIIGQNKAVEPRVSKVNSIGLKLSLFGLVLAIGSILIWRIKRQKHDR